jgi:hypothetical protein
MARSRTTASTPSVIAIYRTIAYVAFHKWYHPFPGLKSTPSVIVISQTVTYISYFKYNGPFQSIPSVIAISQNSVYKGVNAFLMDGSLL